MNTSMNTSHRLAGNPQNDSKFAGSNTEKVQVTSTTKRRSDQHSQSFDDIKEGSPLSSKIVSNEKTIDLEISAITGKLQNTTLKDKTPEKKGNVAEDDYELTDNEEEEFDFIDDSHKHRLLLGEADLSFAVAFTDKHPEVAPFITATTYESEEVLNNRYPDTFPVNKKTLLERNVEVLHSVDARNLHRDKKLKDKEYGYIHFNFPHDGEDYKVTQTPSIINSFLKSAREKLTDNGRVQMALVSDGKTPNGRSNLEFYHGVIYKIADGTLNNNYKLYKKREFDAERYPGYEHTMTTASRGVDAAKKGGREYIFEKMDSDDEEAINENKTKSRKIPGQGTKKYLPEIDTDSESSDYEEYSGA